MIIWYLNHYASPPGSGLPGRPYFLARSMSELGHEVINICASNHHLRTAANNEEVGRVVEYDRVKYLQLKTRSYNGNNYSRLMNMLDYSREVRRLGELVHKGVLPKPNVLIPSCVHLFCFNPANFLAQQFRSKLIFEVRDIWPLSLVELAGVSSWHPLIIWMDLLERRAYKQCDAVVSLLPMAMEHMVPRGMRPEKFNYIPNGISLEEWDGEGEALPEFHQNIFSKLREKKKMIVLYAGAFGPPNALDQIFNLKRINNNKNVPYHFVLIGDGIEKSKLVRQVHEDDIEFVSILPKINKKQVISAIRAADICFMSLKEVPVFRFGVSPNKLGDYLVSGKPIIYAVKSGNDPVSDANAGITVEPYNANQLNNALIKICNMSIDERINIGKNGREFALNHLDWRLLGKKYEKIFNKLCR